MKPLSKALYKIISQKDFRFFGRSQKFFFGEDELQIQPGDGRGNSGRMIWRLVNEQGMPYIRSTEVLQGVQGILCIDTSQAMKFGYSHDTRLQRSFFVAKQLQEAFGELGIEINIKEISSESFIPKQCMIWIGDNPGNRLQKDFILSFTPVFPEIYEYDSLWKPFGFPFILPKDFSREVVQQSSNRDFSLFFPRISSK